MSVEYDNVYEDEMEGKFSKEYGSFNNDQHYKNGFDSEKEMRVFIEELRTGLFNRNLALVSDLYQRRFMEITKRSNIQWPSPEAVRSDLYKQDLSKLPPNDSIFIALYGDLYYRREHQKNNIEFKTRSESWGNYCNFFINLVEAKEPLNIGIPPEWQWDIVDELVYQFHDFRRRSDLDQFKTPDNCPWIAASALNVLARMVRKSQIQEQLEFYATGKGLNPKDMDPCARHPMYKMLGYFCLIGLLRFHCILGDFNEAMKSIRNVEQGRKHLFTYGGVPACQVTTYYHVGFCHMMSRRYAEAINTFQLILQYNDRIERESRGRWLTYMSQYLYKTVDKIKSLLLICTLIHPTEQLDDAVLMQLKDRNSETLKNFSSWDIEKKAECIAKLFGSAAVRVVEPVASPIELRDADYNVHLTSVFMDDVKRYLQLPVLHEYLKLYRSLPLSRLNILMGQRKRVRFEGDVTDLELVLLNYKYRYTRWEKVEQLADELYSCEGDELSVKEMKALAQPNVLPIGDSSSRPEVDFYIHGNMIHIADMKVSQNHGDHFIRNIQKLFELTRDIKEMSVERVYAGQKKM